MDEREIRELVEDVRTGRLSRRAYPHFANGTKDQDASWISYEPLAGFDPEGNVVPILAAEVPTVQNGDLARDLTWVTWRLKKGVTWHDVKPFTADDVVFNWNQFASGEVASNDLVIQDVAVVPVLWRNGVSASGIRLRSMDLSGWNSTLWRLAHWHKSS